MSSSIQTVTIDQSFDPQEYKDESFVSSASNNSVRLFVGALPVDVADETLRHLFEMYGTVVEFKVMKDGNGTSLGHAWLKYFSMLDAEHCVNSLHGQFYCGKATTPLQIKIVSPTPSTDVRKHITNINSPLASTQYIPTTPLTYNIPPPPPPPPPPHISESIQQYDVKLFVGGLPGCMPTRDLQMTLQEKYGPILEVHPLKKSISNTGAAFVKFAYSSYANKFIEDCQNQNVYLFGNYCPTIRASYASPPKQFKLSMDDSPLNSLETAPTHNHHQQMYIRPPPHMLPQHDHNYNSIHTYQPNDMPPPPPPPQLLLPQLDTLDTPSNTFYLPHATSPYYNHRISMNQSLSHPSPSQNKLYRLTNALAANVENRDPLKLFVGCLPYSKTASEIADLFSKYGPLIEVVVLTDFAGKSKGAAFVTFVHSMDANNACHDLQSFTFPNSTRPINVSLANNQNWVFGFSSTPSNNSPPPTQYPPTSYQPTPYSHQILQQTTSSQINYPMFNQSDSNSVTYEPTPSLPPPPHIYHQTPPVIDTSSSPPKTTPPSNSSQLNINSQSFIPSSYIDQNISYYNYPDSNHYYKQSATPNPIHVFPPPHITFPYPQCSKISTLNEDSTLTPNTSTSSTLLFSPSTGAGDGGSILDGRGAVGISGGGFDQ